MGRILWRTAVTLWCLSWIPTVVGLLSERPGRNPVPYDGIIKAICIANAAAFYLGGGFWLLRRAAHLPPSRSGSIILAWLIFLFFSPWGPVSLVICASIMGSPSALKEMRDSATNE